MLPGEVEKIVLPDIQELNSEIVSELIKRIDSVVRANHEIEPVLDEVDRIVLVEHLGLNYEDVRASGDIWKKLMKRRHTRKK